MSAQIIYDSRSARERLRIRAARRLLRSRLTLRLGRAIVRRRATHKPHDRVAWNFFLELAQRLYTRRSAPVVCSSIFVPSELLWGLDLAPFYPETFAGLATGFDLSSLGLEQADALGYPGDLCSFNRAAAGLRAAGFFPPVDFYLASSHLCDVTGQMIAGFAHSNARPFYLLDVPQSQDEAAVDYLAAQLEALVERWQAELGVSFDPARMQRALKLSNQARAFALEVAALREAHPAPLRGSSMLGQLTMLTAMFGHPAAVAYYRALRDYTQDRVQSVQPEQSHQKARLYWMHLKPYFPAQLMPHLEDDLGAVIASEETSTLWWQALDETQPFRSLALKMLAISFNGPVERRVDLALRQIARYQCVGAVHFSHWGCRQSSGAVHVIRARLRRAGVPLLVLDGDCVDPSNLQHGPLRTRVDAFFELLT